MQLGCRNRGNRPVCASTSGMLLVAAVVKLVIATATTTCVVNYEFNVRTVPFPLSNAKNIVVV